jgi:arginine utilization protein RocB
VAEPQIVSFQTLVAEVAAAGNGDRVAQTIAAIADGSEDLPEQCRRISEHVWSLSGRNGPAVVLGFASIPYLPVTLGADDSSRRLRRAVDEARAEIASRFGTPVGVISYFPGISDVSFFGQADDRHVAAIAANTPAWPSIAAESSPFGAAGFPSINVGPWGRDYHTRLERMHADYGFRVLPALVATIAMRVLEAS